MLLRNETKCFAPEDTPNMMFVSKQTLLAKIVFADSDDLRL